MVDGKSEDLYQSIGQMARVFHECIVHFRDDMNPALVRKVKPEDGSIVGFLNAVMALTNESAHKTLDITEKQVEIVESSKQSLQNMQIFLEENKDCKVEELRSKVAELLSQQGESLGQMEAENCKVFETQNFQDLTGQALMQVANIVQDVESSMVTILRRFDPDFDALEGAQQGKALEVKSSLEQDDVDSLLSDLGF